MFKNIKKRDGRTVEFDSLKITSAIARAGKATGEFGQAEASKLTVSVLDRAHASCPDPLPEVEGILSYPSFSSQ
jgi:anaerobic ribonucleoside-triphosphate reductase